MKQRLSLEERNELAFKLRSHILSIENPERLEALADPQYQPHGIALGIYAFEFFLDRYRERFHTEAAEDNVSYIIGWSKGSLRRYEESRRSDRIVRMAAALVVLTAEERGEIKVVTDRWHQTISDQGGRFDKDHLEMFLYEVFYELALELSNELFRTLK